MQITSNTTDDVLEMSVRGRLDNQWADHLTAAIDEAIRLGSHSILLNLAETNYISSAGIGALVKAYKQFQAIRGHFAIVATSKEVNEIIRLMGLSSMLLLREQPRTFGATSVTSTHFAPGVSLRDGLTYESYSLKDDGQFTCEVIGSPSLLARESYQKTQCHAVKFPAAAIGLGLGAFGVDYQDCSNRFGEFVSAGGMSAHQPTNGANKPDYQRVMGDFVPEAQLLYGLRCQGEFARLIRFDSNEESAHVSLSSLVDHLLTLSEFNQAAVVLLAESSGLIGASLRSSPTSAIEAAAREGDIATRFSHPEVRRWLSFSPDRAFSHSLALVVGVVSRGEPSGAAKPLAPFVRPLKRGSNLCGHFHAVTFSYRPFKKRRLDLKETVSALCDSEDLQAVLHLLNDDREITGGGESEFVRGAGWIGPITNVVE